MKDYEKKSSYLKYWDVNNLYGNEVDVQYPDKLNSLHNNLPFFPEKMKIEKVEKL